MEEVGSLRDEDQLLLARELGPDVEIIVTGFATPAQSPSPAQQGFQRGHPGLALFVRDKKRRNFYITVIDLIQQAKVVEVCVKAKLDYWKNPQQARCHSIKDETGGTIGVIFDDQRKADLFYDSVTERIDKLKKKIARRRDPPSPSTTKPSFRNHSVNAKPRIPPPSLKPSLVKPRPDRSPSGLVSPVTPPPNCSDVGQPFSRPEGKVQARPPMLLSPANKPTHIARVNPLSSPLQTTYPTRTFPTSLPIFPSRTTTLTTLTVPTTTLTTQNLMAHGGTGRSSPIPSTTEPSRSGHYKYRPELLPPSFDNPMGCPKDAATPTSGLFKAPRRDIIRPDDNVANGPKLKLLPLPPKVATSTSGGTSHRTHHNGGAADSIQYQGERPRVPVKPVPIHNTPSIQHNRSVHRTQTQRPTNFGRLPPLGTGWNRTSSSPSPTVASPPFSRSFEPVTAQPSTTTQHLQEFRNDDTKHALASQKSWEPQHQSSTSSYTPPWTPLASQKPQKAQNSPSTSSATPSWASAQSRDTESPVPCDPPPLPPIENLTTGSDSEEFPPPPPPESCSIQPHSSGFKRKPQHQNTVPAADSMETMLHGIRSNNPLARLRKVGAEQSPRPPASGGGNDIFSSLQQELLKRKKVIQDPIYNGEVESDSEEWDDE